MAATPIPSRTPSNPQIAYSRWSCPISSSMSRLKWKIEYEKSVICQNFDRKGWMRTEGDDWNIFWATVGTVKQIFNPDSSMRLGDAQVR